MTMSVEQKRFLKKIGESYLSPGRLLNGVSLDLALLRYLDLGHGGSTLGNYLAEQSGSLLNIHAHIRADLGGDNRALALVGVDDSLLDRLVGDSGLGRLGRTLGVPLVKFGDSGLGELDFDFRQSAVENVGVKFAISHNDLFLPHYAVGAQFVVVLGSYLLSLSTFLLYHTFVGLSRGFAKFF